MTRPILMFLFVGSMLLAGCTTAGPSPTTGAPTGPGSATSTTGGTSSGTPAVTGVALPKLALTAPMPGGTVSALEYAAQDPQILYLTSDVNAMGVWKSSDGGGHWTRVAWDENVGLDHLAALAISPGDQQIVLATGLGGRILRTADGGATWRWVHGPSDNQPGVPASGTPNWALAFAASDPSIAYAGADDGHILASSDAGATWETLESPLAGPVGSLAVDPRSAMTLLAGSRGALYRSTDGAASWAKVLSPAAPAEAPPSVPAESGFRDVVQVVFDAKQPDVALAATPAGVYRSTDAGATWTLRLSAHTHSVAFAPSDGTRAYAAALGGLYRSDDAGNNWARMVALLPVTDGRIAVSPTDPDVATLGSNMWMWQFHHTEGAFPHLHGEGIFHTRDGGASWTRSSEGFYDVDSSALAVDPNDPNLVYVGSRCSRGLFRTMDGGASWDLAAGGPANEGYMLAHYTMRVLVEPDSRVLLTTRFGFAYSTDKAGTWTMPLPERHFHGLGFNPADPRIVFMGTSYGTDPPQTTHYTGTHVLRSTDRGATWKDVTQGIPSQATVVEAFAWDPGDPHAILVATSSMDVLGPQGGATALGIFRSSNDGDSWQESDQGLPTKDVEALLVDGTHLYAGTDQGVFRSSDGGRSWSATGLSESVSSLLRSTASPATLYAGTEAGLFQSDDAGDHWTRLDSVPQKDVVGLGMDAKGQVLYAAVAGVGVFKGVTGVAA